MKNIRNNVDIKGFFKNLRIEKIFKIEHFEKLKKLRRVSYEELESILKKAIIHKVLS